MGSSWVPAAQDYDTWERVNFCISCASVLSLHTHLRTQDQHCYCAIEDLSHNMAVVKEYHLPGRISYCFKWNAKKRQFIPFPIRRSVPASTLKFFQVKSNPINKNVAWRTTDFTYEEFLCYRDIPTEVNWSTLKSVPTVQRFQLVLWAT